jgi:hypothetical protein
MYVDIYDICALYRAKSIQNTKMKIKHVETVYSGTDSTFIILFS